ncbi:MAG: redoxin family protein [Acidobacteriota bacterium]
MAIFFVCGCHKSGNLVKFESIDGSAGNIDINALKNTPFLNVKTGLTETIDSAESRFVLIVLLKAADCPRCLKETEEWNKLSREYSTKDLKVIALVEKTSVEETKMLVKGFDIPFTVLVDSDGKLLNSSELPTITPHKFLFEGDQVVLQDGPGVTPESQASFGRGVKRLIEEHGQVQQ